MALAAQPTNEPYDAPFWMGFLLPLTAIVYVAMTISSAFACALATAPCRLLPTQPGTCPASSGGTDTTAAGS